MARSPDHLLLRFTGAAAEPHAVPAAALACALDGFQRIVHLIGMRLEGRTLSRRARPSQDVQRRFVLVCEPPRTGSYEQPLRLAAMAPQLLSPEELERADADLARFLRAIGQRDEQWLEDAVADPTYRRFMLDAFAQAMPEPRSGVALEVLANGDRLLNSPAVQDFVEDQRRPRISAASAGVVSGELTEIDFATRRIRLRLLGVNRDIACSYEDAVEPTLLEHPRELIQVFWSVAVDARGVPKKIEAVEFIRPIQEEEQIPIESFLLGDRSVRARREVTISIRFDREDQLFTATVPPFDIETVGETRDEVAEGVLAELRLLWRNYAQADDGRLAAGARGLKRRLLEFFELFSHLVARWRDLFNASFDVLLYDLTSTYFEIDAAAKPEGDEPNP